jgi:hypothetical protein
LKLGIAAISAVVSAAMDLYYCDLRVDGKWFKMADIIGAELE